MLATNTPTMTREQLLASLEAVAEYGAVQFDDGSYIDFSVRYADGRAFEIGDADGEAVQLQLNRPEMVRLHAALTKTLLLDAE